MIIVDFMASAKKLPMLMEEFIPALDRGSMTQDDTVSEKALL